MANDIVPSKVLHIPSQAVELPRGWYWQRLDDISEGVFDCPHSTPKLVEVGPFVVRSQDIRSGVFRSDQSARVSEDTYRERIVRAEPRHGDLLYSREGTYFGIAAEVPRDMRVCLGQRMVLIRPKNNLADSRYLKYWLNSPVISSHVAGQRDGTVAERLNLPTIRALPIPIAPLDTQSRIGEILGTLDDKIELNRRTNETLEAMAKALFKSWFVDFDPMREKAAGRRPAGLDAATAKLFPAAFEDSPLGPVPKGWKAKKIRDCCVKIHSGGTPSRSEPRYWEGGNIPWLGSGEVRQPLIISTDNFITDIGLSESSAKWVESEATVVALYGATAGQVAYLATRVTTNQAVCALLPLPHFHLFNYFMMRLATPEMESKAVGSAQQNISKGIIEEIQVITPPPEILQRFNGVASGMIDKWIVNLHESRTLAATRDALLPKLLSGEVAV